MNQIEDLKEREEAAPGYVGRVIRILNDSSIIIDAGKADLRSAKKIQVFSILDKVEDLEGNYLGDYYYIKDELNVIQTEERYSVCQKLTDSKWTGALSPLLDQVSREPGIIQIDEQQLSPLPEADDVIHVGDPVKIY